MEIKSCASLKVTSILPLFTPYLLSSSPSTLLLTQMIFPRSPGALTVTCILVLQTTISIITTHELIG
jgi:hypothetical protein